MTDERDLYAFVLDLGRALSLAGTAASETKTASPGSPRQRRPCARIVALPTGLLIAFGQARWTTIESVPQVTGTLRLDQISALYDLVKQAEQGEVTPGFP